MGPEFPPTERAVITLGVATYSLVFSSARSYAYYKISYAKIRAYY